MRFTEPITFHLSPNCLTDEELVKHLDAHTVAASHHHVEQCWNCQERLQTLESEMNHLRLCYQQSQPQPVMENGEIELRIEGALGKYVLLEELNSGGQGLVYRAWDPELQRDVAIKINRKPVRNELAGRFRIQQEGVFLAKIQHQNLARVYDFGIYQAHPYLVMEFVYGMNLQQLVATQTLNESQIRKLLSQIASALAHCHSQGILHLDIKPENIMVSADLHVTLIDFGVSWFLFQKHPGHAVGGTFGFMAPEQRTGNTRQWSEQTDIYGLGALLFFLLTGTTPDCENNEGGRSSMCVQQQLEKVNCSQTMKAACLKALAVLPENRHQCARSFQAALSAQHKWLGGLLMVAGIILIVASWVCCSVGNNYLHADIKSVPAEIITFKHPEPVRLGTNSERDDLDLLTEK